MDVSVFVSCYNHGEFVEQAIESVLNQNTNYKYEIIVCDDASLDNSKDIILNLAKKFPEKIKAVIYEQNIGLIQNFINFVKMAKGEFLAFCEADDWWIDENKIEEQTKFLYENPDHVMVFGSKYHFIQKSKEIIVPTDFRPNFNDQFGFLKSHLESFYIHTSNAMMKKQSLLNFLNTLEKLKIRLFAWDYPLYFYLPTQGNIKFIDKYYSVFRVLDSSITHQINSDELFYKYFILKPFSIYFYLLNNFNYPDSIRTLTLTIFGYQCFHFGNLLKRIYLIERGIRITNLLNSQEEIEKSTANMLLDLAFATNDSDLFYFALKKINANNYNLSFLRKLKILAFKNQISFKLLTIILSKVQNNKFLINIFVKD